MAVQQAGPTHQLEHPTKPRHYCFKVYDRPRGKTVVRVQRWEGNVQVYARWLPLQRARDLYDFLTAKHGYRVFGYSTRVDDGRW